MENLNRIKIGELTLRWALSNKMAVEYVAKMPSTNDTAKDSKGMELILCDHQTQGRGRSQNIWLQQQPGSALLSSWIFELNKAPALVLAPLVGLALFESLRKVWPMLPLSLKAPNDLYLGDKKLGGILIETLSQGNSHKLIIGIGVNVWHSPLLISDCLAGFLPESDLEFIPLWFQFLDHLAHELSSHVRLAPQKLEQPQRDRLLNALNAYPSLGTPYTRIHEDGSLESKAGIIGWSEL